MNVINQTFDLAYQLPLPKAFAAKAPVRAANPYQLSDFKELVGQ